MIKKLLAVLGAAFATIGIVANIKKSKSVYKDKPEEKNPMEGKKVVFIENADEKENADGVRGHLEAVGESNHTPSSYEVVIKRDLDIILSFFGLLLLSPVFLILSLWILIDDPGPILFTQKRVGKDKQYFKLHNSVSTSRLLIDRGVTTDLMHRRTNYAA